jgi:hypothetical protein
MSEGLSGFEIRGRQEQFMRPNNNLNDVAEICQQLFVLYLLTFGE